MNNFTRKVLAIILVVFVVGMLGLTIVHTVRNDDLAQDITLREEVDENEEEGIWGDVISRLKENAITFALLLIFVGGFFVVTYYRNKKNI